MLKNWLREKYHTYLCSEMDKLLKSERRRNNLNLWNYVSTTVLKYTKKVSYPRRYTSISPQSQIMKATEVFGPYGDGWGFESININTELLEVYGFVFIHAIFFYKINKKKISFPINNSWPVKQDEKYDPDFIKKAETNTMSKALSKLGFNADIFLGQFDDIDYVNEQTKKSIEDLKIKNCEDHITKVKEAQEITNNSINDMRDAKSQSELEGLFKMAYRKIENIGDKKMLKSLISNKDAVKKRLDKEKDNDPIV